MDHWIHNKHDLRGAKYDSEKETYFVFDLTDSDAAFQREVHYRVMDQWICNTLDLVGAKYDPDKEKKQLRSIW